MQNGSCSYDLQKHHIKTSHGRRRQKKCLIPLVSAKQTNNNYVHLFNKQRKKKKPKMLACCKTAAAPNKTKMHEMGLKKNMTRSQLDRVGVETGTNHSVHTQRTKKVRIEWYIRGPDAGKIGGKTSL